MRIWHIIYLILCGIIMSVGIAMVWGIGIPVLLVGIFMTSYELVRAGRRDLWAIVVGIGLSQFALAYRQTVTCKPPECTLFFDSARVFLVWGMMILIGVVWGVIEMLRRRTQPLSD